ncbi:hypothetical protein ACFOEE_15095 [Pseudoalteromonas fenneropenaei]|uniref:Uncharacterized protein n=1 Tax=Pseudoalteromonas fenneropenaei TaxID=1737459 RepID=A0ABV7CMU5_9GAMM
MNARIAWFLSCLMLAFATVTFLTQEYNLWDQSLVCHSKCTTLGCKSGQLLRNDDGLTLACKCNSQQDFLILLN